MVTLKNTQDITQVQVNPQPVFHPSAPKPQLQPVKPISKSVTKQAEPKPDANIRNLMAERERRMQVAQLEAQQQSLEQKQDEVMKRMLADATDKLKKLAEYISDNNHLIAREYRVHEGTHRVTVKVYDSVTGEVIREIPGDEFLNRVQKMEQVMGLIFDNLI